MEIQRNNVECFIVCLLYVSSQQVKSDADQSALCDRPVAAISPALPFSSASPTPQLDVASQQAEGDTGGDLLLANTASKTSETQEPPNEKPSCALVPAAEVARVQDFPSPQPIPAGESDSVTVYKRYALHIVSVRLQLELGAGFLLAEMLHGWWKMSKVEEMQSLITAFHSRGIRERVLQKQIQKHLEYIDKVSQDSVDGEFSFQIPPAFQDFSHVFFSLCKTSFLSIFSQNVSKRSKSRK